MSNKPAQFMDCFKITPKIGELSDKCWGVIDVGARDQCNGLEDTLLDKPADGAVRYCYWDGAIFKDEDNGKFVMFASRWNEADGHWGWPRSKAVYAVSDSLYGPYKDMGLVYPDVEEGYGHNVFPLKLHPGTTYNGQTVKYALVLGDTFISNLRGGIFVSESLYGPWNYTGQMKITAGTGTNGSFSLSNIGIVASPDGKYLAYNRHGDIAVSDSIYGPWETRVEHLWDKMPLIAHKHDVEDPIMWYSNGLYHCIANRWDERKAYYMTSEDGVSDWTMRAGTAYIPDGDMIRYDNGIVNHWNKLERPNVYIEEGNIVAMTLAVIDVAKEKEVGNDGHGSKIVVIPFDSDALASFDADPDTVIK